MRTQSLMRTQVRRLRRRALVSSLFRVEGLLFSAGAGLAAWGIVLGTRELLRHPSWAIAAWLSLLLPFGAWMIWVRVASIHFALRARPRLVPYYETRMGAGPVRAAFEGGFAVAADVETLDARAAELGVRALSSFGFADDLLGQHPSWHDPSEAVSTIEALRGAGLEGAVTEDLAAWDAALGAARERGVRFALIARLGADELISPMEMDARAGSFW